MVTPIAAVQPNTFEGIWNKARIYGSTLAWLKEGEGEVDIEIASSTEFSMTWKGDTFRAVLREDVLIWGDGDVWTRISESQRTPAVNSTRAKCAPKPMGKPAVPGAWEARRDSGNAWWEAAEPYVLSTKEMATAASGYLHSKAADAAAAASERLKITQAAKHTLDDGGPDIESVLIAKKASMDAVALDGIITGKLEKMRTSFYEAEAELRGTPGATPGFTQLAAEYSARARQIEECLEALSLEMETPITSMLEADAIAILSSKLVYRQASSLVLPANGEEVDLCNLGIWSSFLSPAQGRSQPRAADEAAEAENTDGCERLEAID